MIQTIQCAPSVGITCNIALRQDNKPTTVMKIQSSQQKAVQSELQEEMCWLNFRTAPYFIMHAV